MKNKLLTIGFLLIIFIVSSVVLFKNENKDTKKIKVAEVAHSIFYAPQYAYEFLCEHKSNYRFSYLASSLMAIYIILNSDIFNFSELLDKKNHYNDLLNEYIKKKRNIFIIIGYERLEGLYNNELKELNLRNNLKKVYKSFNDFYNSYIK